MECGVDIDNNHECNAGDPIMALGGLLVARVANSEVVNSYNTKRVVATFSGVLEAASASLAQLNVVTLNSSGSNSCCSC